MLTNFKPSTYETITWHELTFDDGRGSGFVFPCDEQGHLLPDVNEAAVENYHYCMEHREEFARWNKVVKRKQRTRTNPTGTCVCGATVVLWDQCMGACECESCGRWYNLFGQELNHPDTWASGEDW